MEPFSGDKRSGFIALVGRPNVGKSTLVNRMLGEALAIVTPKPQTTRRALRGILNSPQGQMILTDTPGMPGKALPERKRLFQDFLLKEAVTHAEDADAIFFVIDAGGFSSEDEAVWQLLQDSKAKNLPVCGVINKIDTVSREKLLPITEKFSRLTGLTEIFPVSAEKGEGLDILLEKAWSLLPPGPALFPADQLSDQNDRFLASEMIREQLFLTMSEEIPYAIAVTVEEFEETDSLLKIRALVYVERESQKGMVIGKGGRVLKAVGSAARAKMEAFFGKKVFLELYVKVLGDWSSEPAKLKRLGYELPS
jgi:GTP-binding protein Era